MRHIAVLGTGFAGLHAARLLEESLEGRPRVELVVIGEREYFLYTPLLVHVVSGELDVRAITFPVDEVLGSETRWTRRHIESIDLENRRLHSETDSIAFDSLVLAPGSRPHWPASTECRSSAHPLGDAGDAASIRDQLRQPKARDAESSDSAPPVCVVIGAGPSGVELAAEIAHATRSDHSRLPSWRVVLLERRPRILPDLPAELRAAANEQLDELGVECRTETRATSCSEQRVETESGDSIECAARFWCAGRRPASLLAETDLETDQRGAIRVDARLSVESVPGIYVAGDAASTPTRTPNRADIAAAQGRCAAENVVAELSGRTTKRWRPDRPYPWYLSLGMRDAVVFRNDGVVTGPAAWMLYRMWHTRQLPGALNKAGLLRAWLGRNLD